MAHKREFPFKLLLIECICASVCCCNKIRLYFSFSWKLHICCLRMSFAKRMSVCETQRQRYATASIQRVHIKCVQITNRIIFVCIIANWLCVCVTAEYVWYGIKPSTVRRAFCNAIARCSKFKRIYMLMHMHTQFKILWCSEPIDRTTDISPGKSRVHTVKCATHNTVWNCFQLLTCLSVCPSVRLCACEFTWFNILSLYKYLPSLHWKSEALPSINFDWIFFSLLNFIIAFVENILWLPLFEMDFICVPNGTQDCNFLGNKI